MDLEDRCRETSYFFVVHPVKSPVSNPPLTRRFGGDCVTEAESISPSAANEVGLVSAKRMVACEPSAGSAPTSSDAHARSDAVALGAQCGAQMR